MYLFLCVIGITIYIRGINNYRIVNESSLCNIYTLEIVYGTLIYKIIIL